MSEYLNYAIRNLRLAEDLVSRTMKTVYPVGSEISWKRGGIGKIHTGVVRRHGGDLRIFVKKETREAYWIHFDEIEGE